MVLGNHHFEKKNRFFVHCRCCEHLCGDAEERGGPPKSRGIGWENDEKNLNFLGVINQLFLYADLHLRRFSKRSRFLMWGLCLGGAVPERSAEVLLRQLLSLPCWQCALLRSLMIFRGRSLQLLTWSSSMPSKAVQWLDGLSHAIQKYLHMWRLQ